MITKHPFHAATPCSLRGPWCTRGYVPRVKVGIKQRYYRILLSLARFVGPVVLGVLFLLDDIRILNLSFPASAVVEDVVDATIVPSTIR